MGCLTRKRVKMGEDCSFGMFFNTSNNTIYFVRFKVFGTYCCISRLVQSSHPFDYRKMSWKKHSISFSNKMLTHMISAIKKANAINYCLCIAYYVLLGLSWWFLFMTLNGKNINNRQKDNSIEYDIIAIFHFMGDPNCERLWSECQFFYYNKLFPIWYT